MIILGVDPGTRYAGYAALKREKRQASPVQASPGQASPGQASPGQVSLIDYGCLDVHKLGCLVDKIGTIYEFISKKVKDLKVTHLSIETPFLFKNASTFLKLGYVRGILYLIAFENNLELFEFSPREVKLNTVGYGNASKEQVANVILKLFKIEKPKRDDVTDAIAIALCGL